MIQVDYLVKSFDKKIVVNISSLSINNREIVGIVGNNGAGKTTLFRLFLDLVRADSGKVTINDKNVAESEEWKSLTGSFVDNSFLFECLRPEEYFAFIGMLYHLSASDIKERLAIYEDFMNDEILNQKKYISNFSAGNKQKIGIVGAMFIHPQLLILDEPFNFLDPTSQIKMNCLLHQLHQEFNTTILISSHNLNHITDVSTRILLMEKGLILKDIDNSNKEALSELEMYFMTTQIKEQ
jgi:ABC-2 type transport system ATP-binding protein